MIFLIITWRIKISCVQPVRNVLGVLRANYEHRGPTYRVSVFRKPFLKPGGPKYKGNCQIIEEKKTILLMILVYCLYKEASK